MPATPERVAPVSAAQSGGDPWCTRTALATAPFFFWRIQTSTTFADLLLRLFTASSSAVWASLRWRSKYEIDDGVAHRWQAWLRRRSVDSFFSAPLVRGDGVARRRRRSWSSARDDEDL